MLSGGNFALHIHPRLTIVEDGVQQTVPAQVGIMGFAEDQLIHTHDASGTLHVESPVVRDFTLREFFDIWDQTIANTIIDSNGVRSFSPEVDHETRCRLIPGFAPITVTVGGQRAPSDYSAIVLRDLQNIVITAGSRLPVGAPQIGALSASPNPVAAGSSLTLTATGVTDLSPGHTVSGVTFYRDGNGDREFEKLNDVSLGSGTLNAPRSWQLTTSTSGLAAGTYTYFAVADEGSNGPFSNPALVTVRVQ